MLHKAVIISFRTRKFIGLDSEVVNMY